MIVDFIGMPGAGKSTLVHAVTAALREEGASVEAGENGGVTTADGRALSKWAFRRFRIESILANPGLVATSLAVVIGHGGAHEVPMFVNLCRRDWALRRVKPVGLLLLHESSLHRLCVALALTERTSANDTERFLAWMTWPDAVVYLRVDPQLGHERGRQRLMRANAAVSVPEVPSEADVAWRRRYAEVADHVLRVIEVSRPVLRLEGSTADLSALVCSVRRWLRVAGFSVGGL